MRDGIVVKGKPNLACLALPQHSAQRERPGRWGLAPRSIIPGDSNPSGSLWKPGVDAAPPWVREVACPEPR